MAPRGPFHKGEIQRHVSEGFSYTALEGWQLCIYCNTTTKGYTPIIEMFCWIGRHICPPCRNINKTLDVRKWNPLNTASEIIWNTRILIYYTFFSGHEAVFQLNWKMWYITVNTLNGIHFVLHCMELILVWLSANFKVFETCHRSLFSTLCNICIINTKDYVNFVWCLFSLMFFMFVQYMGLLNKIYCYLVVSLFALLFERKSQKNGYWSGDDCLRHYVMGEWTTCSPHIRKTVEYLN